MEAGGTAACRYRYPGAKNRTTDYAYSNAGNGRATHFQQVAGVRKRRMKKADDVSELLVHHDGLRKRVLQPHREIASSKLRSLGWRFSSTVEGGVINI
jgi:hypothetical protein